MTGCVQCGSTKSSRWYKDKTQCASCNKKEWYSNNKEKASQASDAWHQANRDKVVKIKADWFQKNKEQIYNKRRNKINSDINFRISCNLRSRLANAIKNNKKAGSSIANLGCSIEELRSHLEANWQHGMNWENYGKGKDKWNIDHIIPLCSFDLTVKDQIIKACHYSNLYPTWELDNLKKVKHDKARKKDNK